MHRTALFLVCAAAGAAVVAPCAALAGSYVVHACSPETSPGAWKQVNDAPAAFTTGNLCGGPEIGPLDGGAQGSLHAKDLLGSTAVIPDGARAGWTFTAPPGAIISAISYYRTLASHFDRDVAAGLYQADSSVLDQCRIARPLGSPTVCSSPNNQAPVVFTNLSAPSLFFGVICDIVTQGPIGCSAGSTFHDMEAYMYSANVTVSESSVPAVSDVGGALWAGGLVSGTVAVLFSAADGSGIREQAVRVDLGQTVVSAVHGCDFAVQPPCPQQPGASLNVDTTRVVDGLHTFSLVVTDAAGNSGVVTSAPVVVDNYGPPAPVGLAASARAGSTVVGLSWSNPQSPPAPIDGAMAQVCARSCLPAVGVSPSGVAQVTVPGPGAYSVRVWLLDSAGRGGAHNAAATTVSVPPSPVSAGGAGTGISALLHGRQLRVAGAVAGSGRVRVSWRSKVRGRSVGSGLKVVAVRRHRIGVSFVLARRARTSAATIRVVVRRARKVVGQARVRRR